MRRIILVSLLSFASFNLSAQKKKESIQKSNNWIITLGWNDVDIRTPRSFGDVLDDYFGFDDANIVSYPSKLTIERSLNNSLSMQIGASYNEIKKGFGWKKGQDSKSSISFLGLDGKLKYDLNNLLGESEWFDPFIETGFGVTEYEKQAMVNLKAGWGFNIWFSNHWGANFNSTYNHNFEKSGNDYFQHSVGLAYRFKHPSDKSVFTSYLINEASKWLISAGVNFLDVRNQKSFEGLLKDYFNGDIEDVNAYGVPFRVAVERKLNDKFGVQLGFSKGDFVKPYRYPYAQFKDKEYWNVDLKGTYDLNNLFGQTAWFDPFVNLGIGYSKLADMGDFKVNAGYGANFWLLESVGIKAESSYYHAFNHDGTDFFQHSAGLVYRFGSELADTDGDGILDTDDACPEVAGKSEFEGCPDTDGDGVHDGVDACPEVAGIPEQNGCPDTDGDSLIDKNDNCPKVAGPKENGGCPWPDTDEDGITDNLDKCPEKPGVASNDGCPEIKKEEIVETPPVQAPDCTEEINEINSTEIYFDFDKYNLKSTEIAKLNRVAQIIKNIDCSVELVFLSGYTDPVGTVTYNNGLSQRRAIKVKNYLESVGVTNVSIRGEGYGETKSRNQNKYNRRVELKIK